MILFDDNQLKSIKTLPLAHTFQPWNGEETKKKKTNSSDMDTSLAVYRTVILALLNRNACLTYILAWKRLWIYAVFFLAKSTKKLNKRTERFKSNEQNSMNVMIFELIFFLYWRTVILHWNMPN